MTKSLVMVSVGGVLARLMPGWSCLKFGRARSLLGPNFSTWSLPGFHIFQSFRVTYMISLLSKWRLLYHWFTDSRSTLFPLFLPPLAACPASKLELFASNAPFIAAIRPLFTQPILLQTFLFEWCKGRFTKSESQNWSIEGYPRKVDNNYSWQLWWLVMVLTTLKTQIVAIKAMKKSMAAEVCVYISSGFL